MELIFTSVRYTWGLFDSASNVTPIARSPVFEVHIKDWDYNAGLPRAVANGSVPGTSPTSEAADRPSLSAGAKAGIAIGTILIACTSIAIAFTIKRQRRKRLRKRTNVPVGIYEKGLDNPYSKPELVGTIPLSSGVPFTKPELEARTKNSRSEVSSSEGATLPHGRGTGAPAEPDREQEKQLVESKRLIPHYMEVRESQTGEMSSNFTETHIQTQTEEPSAPATQRLDQSSPPKTTTTTENLRSLKAQERELAHKMEVSESLQRLRAEHAALLDRIRIAEMREREILTGG